MTIENNPVISPVFELPQHTQHPQPSGNWPLKYFITGLLLLIIGTNLSLYNIVSIVNYNNEIICISENNTECAIKTLPCTDNNVTYNNIYEINFSTIDFGLLLAILSISLIAS